MILNDFYIFISSWELLVLWEGGCYKSINIVRGEMPVFRLKYSNDDHSSCVPFIVWLSLYQVYVTLPKSIVLYDNDPIIYLEIYSELPYMLYFWSYFFEVSKNVDIKHIYITTIVVFYRDNHTSTHYQLGKQVMGKHEQIIKLTKYDILFLVSCVWVYTNILNITL